MNYTVNGISRTTADWADCLGVSRFAIETELRLGRTMQDIVHAFSIDTFAADARAAYRNESSFFVSGLRKPDGASYYQLQGLCLQCMAECKDYYDLLHEEHQADSLRQHERTIKEADDFMTTYMKFDEEKRRTPREVPARAPEPTSLVSTLEKKHKTC